MIDPRISLMARVPDLGQTFTNMQNRLNSRETQQQNTQLFDMQMSQGQQQMQDDRDNRRLQSVAEFSATEVLPNIGNPQLLANKLQQRIVMMDNDPNMDSTESREALAQLQNGDIQGLQRDAQASVQLFNMRNGKQQQSGTASQRDFQLFQKLTEKAQSTGAPEDIMAAQQFGQQSGFNRPSMQQEQAATLDAAQDLAGVEISKQEKISKVKATAVRTSALKTEFSTQNKTAARSRIKIQQAKKLAKVTTQGVQGVGKVALSRLFPGIDVSNEATLSQSFKSLALDELQKFKGPTTDFEFSVTEDIAGSLGDGQFANLARLASLDRSAWFAQRESQQFREWEKAGHDPDAFAFNFNEVITIPKNGEKLTYKLIDLQDTAVENHLSIEEVIKALSK